MKIFTVITSNCSNFTVATFNKREPATGEVRRIAETLIKDSKYRASELYYTKEENTLENNLKYINKDLNYGKPSPQVSNEHTLQVSLRNDDGDPFYIYLVETLVER